MYWLGYLSDGRAAGELDWKAIGGTWGCATSMLNTWTPNGHGEIPFQHFDRIIREIGGRVYSAAAPIKMLVTLPLSKSKMIPP